MGGGGEEGVAACGGRKELGAEGKNGGTMKGNGGFLCSKFIELVTELRCRVAWNTPGREERGRRRVGRSGGEKHIGWSYSESMST